MRNYDYEINTALNNTTETEAEPFVCDRCYTNYNYVGDTDEHKTDDGCVCDRCFIKHYYTCSDCNEHWPVEVQPFKGNRGIVCPDCFEGETSNEDI